MTWSERYATNPEFRAKELARSRVKAKLRHADPRQRGLQNAWRRRKYRENHPYRERVIAKSSEWQEANRERKKDYYLRRNYGLSLEKYGALLAQQNGVCLLCLQPPRGRKKLAVDHDHATGRIRGLLHVRCNTVLAVCFGDNPGNMRLAAERLSNGGLRS